MKFASHVNVNELLCKSNLQQSIRYSRMIDGRTIHQYLQFIEPHFFSPYLAAKPSKYKATFPKLVNLEINEILRYCSKTQSRFQKFILEITNNSEKIKPFYLYVVNKVKNDDLEQNEIVSHFKDAINYIKNAGMFYFLELTLEGVVYGAFKTLKYNSKLLSVEDKQIIVVANISSTTVHTAFILLRSALMIFMKKLVLIENWICNDNKLDLDFTNKLVLAFTKAVLIEFQRRLGLLYLPLDILNLSFNNDSFENPELIYQWLLKDSHLHLAKEVFSCWYPYWKRHLFIFNSPLDYITNLEELAINGQ